MRDSITNLADFTASHPRILFLFVNNDEELCSAAIKNFSELSEAYPDLEFVKIVTTGDKEHAKIFAKYGEGKVPFVAAVKDGEKVDYAISMSKARLEALVKFLIKRE